MGFYQHSRKKAEFLEEPAKASDGMLRGGAAAAELP